MYIPKTPIFSRDAEAGCKLDVLCNLEICETFEVFTVKV